VQIEVPSTEASEEEIAAEVEGLRQYYLEYEDITGRAAELGDVASVVIIHDDQKDAVEEDGADAAAAGDEHDADADTEHDADEGDADQLHAHEHPQDIELGAGMMPSAFDEHIVGLKVGEVTEFEFVFDDEAAPEREPMKVKLRLDGLKKKILPELTDEWVKQTVEFADVAELKERIRESIVAAKEQEIGSLREVAASRALAERLVGEAPEQLIKQTEQDNYKDFYKRLQNNRISFDQYLAGNNLTPERFREEMHEQAQFNARLSLALDALARNSGLSISDEEIRAEFERAGVNDPEKLYQEWKRQGRLSEIRQGLLRTKAAEHLTSTAEVFAPGTLEPSSPAGAKAADDDTVASDAADATVDAAASDTKTAAAADIGSDKPAKKPRKTASKKTEAKQTAKQTEKGEQK
ncbi:MAG: hypothetical protein LBP28_00270, partial [Coriobacteriales bacterium]|jgi:trigger factor|nr:hypothetical protein [Coriobacteriales bacterium]